MAEDWVENARTRIKELQAGSSFKLAEGDNSIRILPRRTPAGKLEGQPWEEFMQHNNIGPKKRWLTCGKNIRGEGKCWICDALIPKLKSSDKKPLRARAAAMERQRKVIVQVLYLDDRNNFRGPMVWYPPAGGMRALSTQLMSRLMPGKRDYISLQKGYNLNIERTGSGLATRYGAIIPDDDPTPVPMELVKQMKTFEDIVPKYDSAAQQAAYKGEDVDDEEEDLGYGGDLDETAKDPEPEIEEETPAVTEEEEIFGDEEQSEPADKADAKEEGLTDEEFNSIFDDPPPQTVAKKKAAAKKK